MTARTVDMTVMHALHDAFRRDLELLTVTKQALHDGMREARAGNAVREIGRAVERRAQRSGFKVVRNLRRFGR